MLFPRPDKTEPFLLQAATWNICPWLHRSPPSWQTNFLA